MTTYNTILHGLPNYKVFYNQFLISKLLRNKVLNYNYLHAKVLNYNYLHAHRYVGIVSY